MRLLPLIFLMFTTLYADNFNYVIAEQAIQQRIEQEFPIKYETILLTFHVSNPKLHLDGSRQRFNFTSDLTIPDICDSKGRAVSARVNVTSRIAYSKGGKLYLRKIKVINIDSKFISTDMKSMLYPTLDKLLNEYFKSRPVYSLENEQGLVGAAVRSIENVIIVDKGVKIIFNAG